LRLGHFDDVLLCCISEHKTERHDVGRWFQKYRLTCDRILMMSFCAASVSIRPNVMMLEDGFKSID
jgi:hypothetical protein